MNKKEKLIEKLTEEAKMLREKHGMATTDHTFAIEYIKTGGLPVRIDLDDYDILSTAINDLECLFSDYDVNDD